MKMIKKLFVALALCAPLTAAAQGVEINEENFPDANFREWLLNTDYGRDGVLTAAEIEGVTSMDLYNKKISSLKGIEYFTALTELDCVYNQLTALDISKNTALTVLACQQNQLTSLDVSKNIALKKLTCFDNQLESLDVSKNTALTELHCGNNKLTELDVRENIALETLDCQDFVIYEAKTQLTELDLSNNIALEYLYLSNNQLTTLDVSKNIALKILSCEANLLTDIDVTLNTQLIFLYCGNNQLTELDVTKNEVLKTLNCWGNNLTSLDVSKNTALTELWCYRNQIKGNEMDALINSLPQNITGENYALYIYDNTEANEGNVMTKSQVATAKAKGWTSYNNIGGWPWNEYEGSDDLTSITVAVSADGIATYCPEYDVDFSSATTIAAYKASVNGNTVNLTRVETVAAGEGVLIRSLNGGAVEEELPIAADATANEDNAFVGVLEATTLSNTEGNATNFVLSKVDGVVGFFKANNTQLAAGKAYLPVENYNAARSLTIVFDDTTGIIEVAPEQADDDAAVYTLGGVRTTTPQKGLYIKNGKKVMVK